MTPGIEQNSNIPIYLYLYTSIYSCNLQRKTVNATIIKFAIRNVVITVREALTYSSVPLNSDLIKLEQEETQTVLMLKVFNSTVPKIIMNTKYL